MKILVEFTPVNNDDITKQKLTKYLIKYINEHQQLP